MPLAIDRRSLLGSSGAAIAVALLPRAAWAAAIPAAPVARVAPVTETLYGTAVTDNYRWMEDARDAEWLPFLKGQDAHARAVLASIPGRDAILKRVAALSGDAAITTKVQVAGARTFYEQRPAGADNYQLFVRDAAGTRVLVDPVALGTRDAHVSLDWWNASFDGSHLVYGLSPSGSEESVGQIMVVATGEILPERLPDANFASPAWLADGSGFFHTRLTGPKKSVDRYKNAVALLHKLRTDPATDRRILQRGSDPAVAIAEIEVPVILTTPGSDAALALLINGVQNEVKAFSAPLGDALADRARWSKVCDTSDNVTGIALLGADLYLLANTGAIRGQVLRTPALKPDLGTAAVALPMGATVVEGITAARDGIYVTIMDGGIERLRRIAPDGRVADVALPFDGSIQAVFTSTDADGAQLWLSGWLNPSAIWQVDAGSLKVADTRLNPLPPIDLSPYEYTRLYATAKDGVRIPVAVLRRKDAPRDGKRPTIVDAYGAYQISQTPSFRARGLAWLDQGGVYAVANVRGGGEYGREWHAAGRKATKSNTWRDLIAACEALIAAGLTSPATLAIKGGSAGGITVGRAMTERPELFAAVIDNVGVSNTVRVEFSPNGPGNIPEYGSVTDEAGFRGLLAMDSTQAIKPGTRYPAVLLTTGATDPRVEPWQVAKMTAGLQAATAAGRPILLRVEFDAGHGIGSTRAQTDAVIADEFAFVLWQAGARGFQPA